MSMLAVSGLRKSFGGVVATDGVELAVEQGELHAIIGPNGAGKTTLISQLSGQLKPDSGSIRFEGEEVQGKPAYTRRAMGIARSFQITSLVMSMTVADNVALAIQARQGHSFKFLRPARKIVAIQNEAREFLQRVGLLDRADEQAKALSHGEHRQLEIAIAMATGARMLLLDEPMAGLGAEESVQMVDLLKSLKGDKTILLIEHDMDAVFALADRISVIVYGRVIATGNPEEIRSNAAVQEAYLGEHD